MLAIRDINLFYQGQPVLQGIDLKVSQGEILCLLGASGCGKTSLLRVIAGLERPDAGDIRVNDRSVLSMPVHTRDFGLMFQDFALFPHLNVAGNITFGLKMHGIPRQAQQERLREVLALVGLTGFENRDVTQLSGGERQRVALARSLAPNPHLLMLDEPLGALDAQLKEHLVVELRTIIKQSGVTAIYVTHDQREAFAIADRVAVMNAGRIQQVGVPEDIYRRPASVFVSRFLGLNNVFSVQSRRQGVVETAVGEFPCAGEPEAVLLHPDGISLVDGESEPRDISGVVVERVFSGRDYQLALALATGERLSFTTPAKHGNGIPLVGETAVVRIDPARVIPLVDESIKSDNESLFSDRSALIMGS
ncbi:MAG: ABC transporter ATP-binding protein [Anaerolineaceae bacterium]|nr:ABC transporter ATP-binding protein [Anaerolineaceae bacterium]